MRSLRARIPPLLSGSVGCARTRVVSTLLAGEEVDAEPMGLLKRRNPECAHISGCKSQARPGGFCITHGGPKPTRRKCAHISGCTRDASGAHVMCVPHGCPKRTVTLLRCTHLSGCTRFARPGFRTCAGHGGGKRCAEEGCDRTARGASEVCAGHGGGKRCAEEGCPNGAQGATDHCKVHGGGKTARRGPTRGAAHPSTTGTARRASSASSHPTRGAR
jgi:hypothetical protein